MLTKHSFTQISLFALLGAWVSGCTAAGDSLLTEERVPVQLCARDGALSRDAAAGNLPEQEFEATVALSTVKGDYASLSEAYEGTWDAIVRTNGTMEWKAAAGAEPVYPPSGDWLYLTAFAPAAVPVSGVASFVLTGQTDLLYAAELRGNKWEGERFAGNRLKADRPLEFSHLLTQLCFKACKGLTDGVAVSIRRITVNGALPCADLTLATGVPVFSATEEHPAGLSLSLAGPGTEVTGTVPVEIGTIQVPPLQAGGTYTLTVETSIGTFSDLTVNYATGENLLQAGMSHTVTLTIGDHELGITSVTVQPWTTVTADGNLEAE